MPAEDDATDPPTTNPAAERDGEILRAHGRWIAIVFAGTGIGIFAASFLVGFSHHLPADAFEWAVGLRVLRAAVVVAILWALALVLLRGWEGRWPSRMSTSGVEFEEFGAGSKELERAARFAVELTRGIAELREERR